MQARFLSQAATGKVERHKRAWTGHVILLAPFLAHLVPSLFVSTSFTSNNVPPGPLSLRCPPSRCDLRGAHRELPIRTAGANFRGPNLGHQFLAVLSDTLNEMSHPKSERRLLEVLNDS